MGAARLNPGPMALWATLILVVILLGMATLPVGRMVAVPWLAHASWHAFRELAGTEKEAEPGCPALPHPMCRPPLQLKSAPVVKPESSPASQATTEPISSGRPRRFTGMVATIFSSTSGLMARTMSVPM